MPIKSKYLVPAFFIVLFIPVILLSTSLSNLEMDSHFRLPASKETETTEPKGSSGPGHNLEIVYRLMLIITGLLIPISLVALLRTKKGRSKLLMLIILFLIWTYFVPVLRIQFPKFHLNLKSFDIGESNNFKALDDRIPEPSPWLVLSISLGLSVLVTGGIYFLWRRFKRRSNPIDVVARETLKAIDDLKTGRALKEGVIRYYDVMIKAVMKYRGLKRDRAMTSREFEKYLEEMGLPNSPIIRLSRLFEKVRYGAKDLDESENREAVECLTAIFKACRAVK